MIDMKLLRTEPEKVIAALARRKENADIDGLLSLDKEKREILYEGAPMAKIPRRRQNRTPFPKKYRR